MKAKELIHALAQLVDAKKATDKAYKNLSKAFCYGSDEELHAAVVKLQDELSKYAKASNYTFMATLNK